MVNSLTQQTAKCITVGHIQSRESLRIFAKGNMADFGEWDSHNQESN